MKTTNLIFIMLLLLLFVSCGSTRIASSWKDSDTHVHLNQIKKVLVASLLNNETNRRIVEDELVKKLNGKGIASYQYLDERINNNIEEELMKKLKADGFDTAITMRFIDVDKERVYVPAERHYYPNYYNNFGRYYQRSWSYYTRPGYFVVTKKFVVETVIYSITEDKIIWSGITETFDPEGVSKMTDEISSVIFKKMQDEGLIQ